MASIKQRGNILWIKFYDRLEGKYKEFSTKIRATKEGRVEAKKLLKRFESNYDMREMFESKEKRIGIREGLKEFLESKVLRAKTVWLYEYAVNHLIEACGEKNVNEYKSSDNHKLMMLFDKKNFSENTKGIVTTHLYALFNFFKANNYIKEIAFKKVARKVKLPECYDDGDLAVILDYLKNHDRKKYYFILFLLFTGFRISTALEVDWKNIDFENGFIIAKNVKRDRDFFFPITDDVLWLLKEIGLQKEGKVFDYKIESLKSYGKLLKRMEIKGVISKHYTLHQLRKTFITKLLENGLAIHKVRALADHKDISTTLKYYAAVNVKKMGNEMNGKGIFRDIYRDNKRLLG